jgi:effector-binding domain-containing protein
MKTKLIINVVVSLTFLLLIYFSLDKFLPKEIKIEKPIAIGDSLSSVFGKVNSSGNWAQWMSWIKVDTSLEIMNFGAEKGEGAGLQWSEIKEISSGKFVILKSFYPDSILYEMNLNNFGVGYGSFLFRQYSKGTYLTWTFRLYAKNNLYKRFQLIEIKKSITVMINESLQYLKSVCEYEATHHIDMNFTNLPEYDYLYIRDECFAPEISDRMSTHFGTILKYMAKENIKQKGFPFCIYHKVSDTMAFSVCMPVAKIDPALTFGEKIKTGHLNPDEAIVANYHGDYSSMGNAHVAIQQWITESHKKITGDPIEMYITGPGEVADSSRWFTKIFYPVK